MNHWSQLTLTRRAGGELTNADATVVISDGGVSIQLSDLSSPTCLVTPDGAEDRLRVGGNLGLEGELLAVDLDRR